jgi:hypothetical protein
MPELPHGNSATKRIPVKNEPPRSSTAITSYQKRVYVIGAATDSGKGRALVSIQFGVKVKVTPLRQGANHK